MLLAVAVCGALFRCVYDILEWLPSSLLILLLFLLLVSLLFFLHEIQALSTQRHVRLSSANEVFEVLGVNRGSKVEMRSRITDLAD